MFHCSLFAFAFQPQGLKGVTRTFPELQLATETPEVKIGTA
jgi:hypothetical protein